MDLLRILKIYKSFSREQKRRIYDKYLNYKLHCIMTGYEYSCFDDWVLSFQDLPNIFIQMAEV